MLPGVIEGRWFETLTLKNAPDNQENLCNKAWNASQFVHSPESPTYSLIGNERAFEERASAATLGCTISRLKAIKSGHGEYNTGSFASTRHMTEDNSYQHILKLQKRGRADCNRP